MCSDKGWAPWAGETAMQKQILLRAEKRKPNIPLQVSGFKDASFQGALAFLRRLQIGSE
jgi:hypothetical protein